MFKELLIYFLVFAIAFPPGSLPQAYAQIESNEQLLNEVTQTGMDLTSMLMQHRYPGVKTLSFQKAPSLANLTLAEQTLSKWKKNLELNWQAVLAEPHIITEEGLQKMTADAEVVATEMISYFQMQYMYLANLSFLSPPDKNTIDELIRKTEIKIAMDSVINQQFYLKVWVNMAKAISDVVGSSDSKAMDIKIDHCASTSLCLTLSLNKSSAYRALESVSQYKDDNDSFQHFARLLVLENYVTSYAKLDYYLNPAESTLNLPKALSDAHPSLPYLYQNARSSMDASQEQFRFSVWLDKEGRQQLQQILKALGEDPNADLLSFSFIKKYIAILKSKTTDSSVLTKNRLEYIKKNFSGAATIEYFVGLALVTSLTDENDKFKSKLWYELMLTTVNVYLKNELLADPQLTRTEKIAILDLIKKEEAILRSRIDAEKYQTMLASLYQSFQKSLKRKTHESVIVSIYQTAEDMNLAQGGLDYEALIIAMQQTREFRNLNVREPIKNILTEIQEQYKDGFVKNPLDVARMHSYFSQAYFKFLYALVLAWAPHRPELLKNNLSLKELEQAVDQERKSVPGYYEDLSTFRIEKDLHDWLKIGHFFKVFNDSDVLFDDTNVAFKDEDITIHTFNLDASGLEAYQDIIEQNLSSRFPVLTAHVSTSKTMNRMERDQKSYQITVQTGEKPLWKLLKDKTLDQATPLIINQLKASRSFIQTQINELAEEMNSKASLWTKFKTHTGLSRFDEENGQIPEYLALHLAYSSVLTAELKNYFMTDRLASFRRQQAGDSDFKKALDKYIGYTAYYFYAVIGTQILSYLSFRRIPFLSAFLNKWIKAPRISSMLTRDGLIGKAASFRGHPIKLLNMPLSWLDVSFYATLGALSVINIDRGLGGLTSDVPFLDNNFKNQVSCSDQSSEVEYSKQGCVVQSQTMADAAQSIAYQNIGKAAITAILLAGMTVGLPKAIQFAQKYLASLRTKDFAKTNETLEKLLQDVGFSGSSAISYSIKDLSAMTNKLLKDIKANAKASGTGADSILAQRIFLHARYKQLKTMVQTENAFWQKVDNTLAIHWKRLGITQDSKNWSQRFDEKFMTSTYNDLYYHFVSGRITAKQYEALTQDAQTIIVTLNPAWALMRNSVSGVSSNYSRLVRHSIELRTGTAQSLPTVNSYEVTDYAGRFSALWVRSVINSNKEVALVRLTPYQMSPEAKLLAEELKQKHLNKNWLNRIKNLRETK